MNYERMLRAYMAHVLDEEGVTFSFSWNKQDFMDYGCTEDEAAGLVALGEEVEKSGR